MRRSTRVADYSSPTGQGVDLRWHHSISSRTASPSIGVWNVTMYSKWWRRIPDFPRHRYTTIADSRHLAESLSRRTQCAQFESVRAAWEARQLVEISRTWKTTVSTKCIILPLHGYSAVPDLRDPFLEPFNMPEYSCRTVERGARRSLPVVALRRESCFDQESQNGRTNSAA